MSWRNWIAPTILLFLASVVLSVIGFPFFDVNVPFLCGLFGKLLVGWMAFLVRVLPSVRFHVPGLLLAVFALGSLTFLLDLLLHQWRKECGKSWRRRDSLAIVVAGVSICISGICLVGMVHELIWIIRADERLTASAGGRETSRRMQSKYNLLQIGMGLTNYHQAYSWYPRGGTFGPGGRGGHGWMTFILPYCDQAYLYDRIDLNKPWNDPSQRSVFETRIHPYEYPVSPRQPATPDGYAPSSYAANGLVLGGSVKRCIGDIIDGTSTTLIAGEANGNFKAWGHPANWRDVSLGINQSPDGFGSPFVKNGANFLMCDGSARVISENIAPHILKALATPDGGETVGDF